MNPASISNKRFKQGYYKCTYPQKYIGDASKIIYRSGWEFRICYKLDHASYVKAWACEPFAIKYISPRDGLPHRYFPDFIVVATDGKTTLIECKPSKEQFPPKRQGKKKSRYLKEAMQYEVNQAKWEAAKKLCKKKGWNWCVLTEKEILGKQ